MSNLWIFKYRPGFWVLLNRYSQKKNYEERRDKKYYLYRIKSGSGIKKIYQKFKMPMKIYLLSRKSELSQTEIKFVNSYNFDLQIVKGMWSAEQQSIPWHHPSHWLMCQTFCLLTEYMEKIPKFNASSVWEFWLLI